MDFRVKKLILEEGMKNIAETEGVKLEMSFDEYRKTCTVDYFEEPCRECLDALKINGNSPKWEPKE